MIVDTYLADQDCTALLAELGLSDHQIAEDLSAGSPDEPPSDPAAAYQRLCGIAGRRAQNCPSGPKPHTILRQARSAAARQAVLLRSHGRCENLAHGGPDLPEQMIALCPNCHAIKTRGRTAATSARSSWRSRASGT